jgi:hypothetical protein
MSSMIRAPRSSSAVAFAGTAACLLLLSSCHGAGDPVLPDLGSSSRVDVEVAIHSGEENPRAELSADAVSELCTVIDDVRGDATDTPADAADPEDESKGGLGFMGLIAANVTPAAVTFGSDRDVTEDLTTVADPQSRAFDVVWEDLLDDLDHDTVAAVENAIG